MKKVTIIPSLSAKAPNKIASILASSGDTIYFIKKSEKASFFQNKKCQKLNLFNFLKISNCILHTHGFIPDVLAMLLKSIKNKSIKTVTTLHSNIDLDLIDSKKYLGKAILKIWLLVLKRIDLIICMNKTAKAMLISKGIDSSRIKIIKNGIEKEIDQHSSEELKIEKQEHIINCVSWSVIRKMKGHQNMIHTLSLYTNINYYLYGDGDYLNNLIQLAKINKVENRCHFLGYKNNFLHHIKNYDVFIILSEFEGSPLALLEAVRAKIPCVCNDISTFRELFDENDVVFCNGNNADSIKNAIQFAYKNSDMLTTNAYNKFIKNYTSECMLKKYHSTVNFIFKAK